jgi:hypothetical protein
MTPTGPPGTPGGPVPCPADGAVVVTYANGSRSLKLQTTGGNLHAYHVRGGPGLAGGVRSKDMLTLAATAAVSPAQTITSP